MAALQSPCCRRLLVPLLLFAGQAGAAVLDGCASISSDTTWTAGNVYRVENCNLLIEAGATLTLEAGVIVKVAGVAPGYASGAGSAAVIVDGSLIANGSAAQPVVFTSLRDDSRGGDNNEDGDSQGSPADWWGIVFRAGSSGRLQHFYTGFAGSGVFNATLGYNRAQIDLRASAVELLDGEIAFGRRSGVYLEGSGFTPTLQRLHIHDNTDGNDGFGNDRAYAVFQSDINMQPSYADLVLEANDVDKVVLHQWFGTLGQSITLAGARFGTSCNYTSCQLTVPSGLSLTVAPGTTIDFSDPAYGSTPYGLILASGGSLMAQGTPQAPVAFTSSRAAAGEARLHWEGITAQAGSRLRLSDCDLGYGGGYYGSSAVLRVETDDAEVDDCRIHHGSGDGLVLSAPAQTSQQHQFSALQIESNHRFGLNLVANYASRLALELSGGVINHSGWAGVETYTWESSLDVRLIDQTIAGNGRLMEDPNDPRRSAGFFNDDHNVSLHLEGVDFVDNLQAAVYWYCNGSLSASQLTAVGNGRDAIVLPRCDVWGGRQWNIAGAGIPLLLDGSLYIKPDSFLTLSPGSTLRFAANSQLYLESGALYALGTAAAPIRLLGQQENPGSWAGISLFGNSAALYVSECEIAHAGSGSYQAAILIGYALRAAVIQNCDIHHNVQGIVSQAAAAVIRNNTIRDNDQLGVAFGGFFPGPVDARGNWWGVASGPYHPTLNPGGEGDQVGDNVLFEPWLEGPPASEPLPGDTVVVSTGAPDFVSPGQTVDYAISFLNLRSTTVENALLVLQLPQAAEYVGSSGGGVYSPERDQVIWRLGDLAASSYGAVSASLRFAWGLPRGYRDRSMTLLSGDNYQPELFSTDERAALQTLEAPTVSSQRLLSAGEYSSERSTYAALAAAHSQAELDGYQFHSAAEVQRSDAQTVMVAVFLHPGTRAARLLSRTAAQVFTTTFTAEAVTVEDAGGGMRLALDSGLQSAWGSWSETSELVAAGLGKQTGCSYESCRSKCRWQLAGLTYLGKKAGRILAWTALGLLSGGTSAAGAVYEVGSFALDYQRCDLDCFANPNAHCCTAGQIKWSNGGGLAAANACFKSECSPIGTWKPSGAIYCVAFGQRCVASIGGSGCVNCEERLDAKREPDPVSPLTLAAAQQSCASGKLATGGKKPRCRDLDLFVAKDPNDITGPNGDVQPGQQLNYTIRYENVGEGSAYGVYITNDLPPELDEASLVIGNGGWLVADRRQLVWLVGELGRQGSETAEGAVSYTVRVKTGLASGTPIANAAVVYFPSVPEATPTNTWVNLVAPLAALPQTLDTGYTTPLAITLEGREVSALPLSFQIEQAPLRGELTGSPPELIYTPAAGTVGEDSFSFTVSNGTSRSRPAEVLIRVGADGDSDAPEVVSTSPSADEAEVALSSDPLYFDREGPIYAPVIVLALSEALDADGVVNGTVELIGPAGNVPARLSYDGQSQRLLLSPRQALQGEASYQVRLHSGLTDIAGNPLAAMNWSFATGQAPPATPTRIFRSGFEAGE